MPRYQVCIDLGGIWEDIVDAKTEEEAIELALSSFENNFDGVAQAIEPSHPTDEDVEVYVLAGGD